MPPCDASGGLLKYEGRVEQELAASTENQKGKGVEMIRYDTIAVIDQSLSYLLFLTEKLCFSFH